MARPHIEPYVELNEDYKKFNLPAFSSDASYKVLSLDVDSGACSLKMQFNAGFKRKPGVSYSDMEMFILKGLVKVGDELVREGHYFFIPAGYAVPAMESTSGFEALVYYNDAEPSFEESDVSHKLTNTAAYVSHNGYEDLPWASGSVVQPSTATGVFVKILRFDPLTEGFTFLYTISPEFVQDNISYHDCAEESYHIWGTSWMMQFGDLPTGGYFWRPPYINHGSFRSKMGCIALGRTDNKLHNYFHYNPWSNPQENIKRSAAHLYRQRPDLWKWVKTDGHNHPHGPSDFEHPDYHTHHNFGHHHDGHHHHHYHGHDIKPGHQNNGD